MASLRRPRDDDDGNDDFYNFDADLPAAVEELAAADNRLPPPPDPMDVEETDDDDDELAAPRATQPTESYLGAQRRRRQERAWARTAKTTKLSRARTIRRALPLDPTQWDDRYLADLEHELKRQTSAPIPTSTDENLVHLHELIRLVELVACLTFEQLTSSMLKQVNRLGECVWTYYTHVLHARGAPKVDTSEWWRLFCLLRYTIVTCAPAHALFVGDWYQRTTINQLLQMNAEAAAYLGWAHASGWTLHEPPSSSSQQQQQQQQWDYLSAAGSLPSVLSSPAERTPTPRFAPIDVETLVIPQSRDRPVADLTIDRCWVLLSRQIHHNFNRLRWTPATELLVVLLWHHVSAFTLGRAPQHLFTGSDSLWEERAGFLLASDLLVDCTGHILIRHLACIHAFHSLRTRVINSSWQDATLFANAVPLGLYDQLAVATPEFLPTRTEQALIEDGIERAHAANSYQILPGQTTIDKHAVKDQYKNKLPRTVLVPGDTAMLAIQCPAIKLAPRTVLVKYRGDQDGILADLVIPYTAAATIFKANRQGDNWPRGQEDLEIFGAQAHTALYHAVLRALEAGRPDRIASTAEARRQARERHLHRMLTNPDASLRQAVRQKEHELYKHAADDNDNDQSPSSSWSTHNDMPATATAVVVERQPPLDRWWLLCEDSQFDLPMLYPRTLASVLTPKNERRLPTQISVRGEHWLVDTEHWAFVGRTTHQADAQRAYACLTAFLYPDDYETHLEPLLVHWYNEETLQAYARAGRTSRLK